MQAPTIRAPWWAIAALGLASAVAALVFALYVVSSARRGELGSSAIALVVLLLGVLWYVRCMGVRLRLEPDELIVRNAGRTHRLPRADILRFAVGRRHRTTHSRTIYAVMRDGSRVPMDAAAITYTWGSGMTRIRVLGDVLGEWRATGRLEGH